MNIFYISCTDQKVQDCHRKDFCYIYGLRQGWKQLSGSQAVKLLGPLSKSICQEPIIDMFFRACFKGMVTLKICTEIRTIGVDFECERTLNDQKVLPGKEPNGHRLVVGLEICVALQPSRSIVAPITNVFQYGKKTQRQTILAEINADGSCSGHTG